MAFLHDAEKGRKRPMMEKLLSGKNVLITGAGKNIGRYTALEMAKEGANIYFTDIDENCIRSLEKDLNDFGTNPLGFRANITEFGDIDFLDRSLSEHKIQIDILVNNVGISPSEEKRQHLDDDLWRIVFETNLFGPIYLTKKISSTMIKNKIRGSIIFLSSIHQWFVRGVASYSASKAALGMLINELAVEYAQYGIRVNGIAPGYIGQDDKEKPIPHRYTPLYQSSVSPCYIGRAAVYLSADYYSKFTTGTVLKIDAGLSLFNHILAHKSEK
jgi:NAD(P)-dependent dehydrogenase (short-subunit alcohol dehydrogenase family)